VVQPDQSASLEGVTLKGTSPFVATPLPANADVETWLSDFPSDAMRGVGLADRSVISLWEAQTELNPQRRVYVWSLDKHLSGYDTRPPH
jgi:hypothetical protein